MVGAVEKGRPDAHDRVAGQDAQLHGVLDAVVDRGDVLLRHATAGDDVLEGVELALAGVPMVVAYRMNPLTSAIVRAQAKIDYPSIINVILDRPAIPELLQGACKPAGLAREVMKLLTDADARARQVEDARKAMAQLGVGGKRPSERAADVVLAVMREGAS